MSGEVPPFAFAVIGREHVGKTSLINALCGTDCSSSTSSSAAPVLHIYPKNKAIVFWDFPPFGSEDLSHDASAIKGFDLNSDIYEGIMLVCDNELAPLDKSLLEKFEKMEFRRVIVVRNKVNTTIEFDRTLCAELLEEHSPDHVFSQCIASTYEHFSACKTDKIFVVDTLDTDKFHFSDLDNYLQGGVGINRAKPVELRWRSGNHGRKHGGNYQQSRSFGAYCTDEKYPSADYLNEVDEPTVVPGAACADQRVYPTSTTSETDAAMSPGARDIGFDLSQWNDDVSDITANEGEVSKYIQQLSSPKQRQDLVRNTWKELKRWEEEKLDIAVTGNAGVGKSSFINAIRDVKPGDAGWAPVDVVEGTMRPTQYNHPVFPNIVLWDLPGVGTERFRRETYMEQVAFEKYDFYIIICAGRFTEIDLWLADTIRQKGKTFFFVRTKVRQDIDNAKLVYAGKRVFDENFVIRKIRQNCFDSLPTSRRREVFLIDNYKPQLYDFGKLAMAIIHASPPQKRQVATFGMCLLTEDVIKAKEEELKKRIWKTALMVAVTDASPVDFLGISSTDDYLVKEAQFYREQFQLTDAHLEKYALAEGKTKQEFVECMQLKSTLLSHRAKLSTLIRMLSKASTKVHAILIPVVMAVASGAVSFGTAMKFLRMALDIAVEDVRKINRAMKSHRR